MEQQLPHTAWLQALPAALRAGERDAGLPFGATSVTRCSLCPAKCGFVTGGVTPNEAGLGRAPGVSSGMATVVAERWVLGDKVSSRCWWQPAAPGSWVMAAGPAAPLLGTCAVSQVDAGVF